MVNCKECGREISSKAKNCPQCGADTPKGMTVAKLLIPIIVILIIWQASRPDEEKAPLTEAEIQSRLESDWIAKGQVAVESRLKDGDSAEFRNVFFSMGKKNMPATCGEVNAKNSFGAFTEYERFIFLGSAIGPVFESDMKDFYVSWKTFCEK